VLRKTSNCLSTAKTQNHDACFHRFSNEQKFMTNVYIEPMKQKKQKQHVIYHKY